MKILFAWVVCGLVSTGGFAAESGVRSAPVKELDIPYQKFVLKNGLTLIVHEDHKVPIVCVDVWYHVGSKNEKPGRTGFAHLFEHLMFNGSEHFNDDYFKAMEKVGASELNGTTCEDRTNYFENAPKEALDFLLWMESDRMGHLLGAMDQARLNEQRGVVQNEKRQQENQPYAISDELIVKATFPPGHPYSWTVIGSMEDLNAASLEDVREWFRNYYGASKATVVVAGDVDPEQVREKVEKYFGDIPAGPPLARCEAWVAKRTGEKREVAQDRVPQSRIYKVWNTPQFGTADSDYLALAAQVLSEGKSSRLYKRLVYDDQLATDVSAFTDTREIGGQFVIVATARPDVSIAKVERAIDEEMARFLHNGPSREEMLRARTQTEAAFIRSAERIGGFGGKSDTLAMYQVYLGQPDAWKTTLQHMREAMPLDVRDAARRWLSDGVYVLAINPFPEYQTVKSDVDRSKLPVPVIEPEGRFPKCDRFTLSNGLKVILAERHAVPVVNLSLIVDAGYASDLSSKPGTAKLAMGMLDEGTKSRTAMQISDDLDRLGAKLSIKSDLDSSSVSMSALKKNLPQSLEIFADVIENPNFPEQDFDRLQKLQLDRIRLEKTEPNNMGLRVLPRLLYGDGHPYGMPFTGSGTEESVSELTRADVLDFYKKWFMPNNATLVVVGDTTTQEIKPELERLFADWESGEKPKKASVPTKPAGKPVVYIIDRPGSLQSAIFAGEVGTPMSDPQEITTGILNDIVGGNFTSRLNMNLREDKHWAYGARSNLVETREDRPFYVLAPVQSDKTSEAMAEIQKELQGIAGNNPPTKEEVAKIQKDRTLKMASAWETSEAIVNSISRMVRFQLPDDYYDVYPKKVLGVSQSDVGAAAKKLIHPDHLVWVIVGDRAKIEAGIRKLGIGEVRVIDPDGNEERQKEE